LRGFAKVWKEINEKTLSELAYRQHGHLPQMVRSSTSGFSGIEMLRSSRQATPKEHGCVSVILEGGRPMMDCAWQRYNLDLEGKGKGIMYHQSICGRDGNGNLRAG
jgi:hypothetical protein